MDKLKSWWNSFIASFHDSEIIWIARAKLFAGTTFTALQTSGVDVTSFVENPRIKTGLSILFAWLIVDGTVQEWARKRRADDLGPTDPADKGRA
jgi:hypothetical protein